MMLPNSRELEPNGAKFPQLPATSSVGSQPSKAVGVCPRDLSELSCVRSDDNLRFADSPTEKSYLSFECNGDIRSAGLPERNRCTWTRYSGVPHLKPRASAQIP
jgi:hypothetical protein